MWPGLIQTCCQSLKKTSTLAAASRFKGVIWDQVVPDKSRCNLKNVSQLFQTLRTV